MKRILVILLVLVLAVLLFPMRLQAKDGGTVVYKSILYTVRDMHAISDVYSEDGSVEHGYIVGTVIKILGFEIFDNTRWVPQE